MKRFVLGLFLLSSPALRAMSPDLDGSLGAGLGLNLSGSDETAQFRSGLNLYQDRINAASSYGADADLVIRTADSLSLSLNGAHEGFENDLTETKLNGLAGSAQNRTLGSYGSLGLGLRFYPAAFFMGSFDPWEQPNPDGFLHWPSFSASLSTHSGTEDTQTVLAGGYYTGYDGSHLLSQDYLDSSYSLQIPVAEPLSLTLGYSRQLNRRIDLSSASGHSVHTDDGGFESLSGTLTLFSHLHERPRAGRVHYLPHIGFPGMARLNLSYGQSYDLSAERMSQRSYEAQVTYVLMNGVGLSADYGFSEVAYSRFNSSADVTADNPWSQFLGFNVSCGWGTLRAPAE